MCDNKVLDKFALRYGAIPGRCNAKRKKHPGKLCQRYPLKGSKRCKLHGGGWNTKPEHPRREMARDRMRENNPRTRHKHCNTL